MTGIIAAGANTDTKEVKNPSQHRWNARMCGDANDNSLSWVDLCSLSTRQSNPATLIPSAILPVLLWGRGNKRGTALHDDQ